MANQLQIKFGCVFRNEPKVVCTHMDHNTMEFALQQGDCF